MRARFWLPCFGFALIGAAACSLAIGKADLSAVHCEQEGQQGAPSCAQDQICLQGVCTDCSAAGNCDGAGGQGGAGGEGGVGGGTGGTGGDEAGPDVNQGGSAGTGGITHDSGTGGTTPDVGPDLVEEPPPPDVVQEPPVVLKKLGDACDVSPDCEPGLFCSPTGAPWEKTCSKSCCTSSDAQCGAGAVCVPASAGGMCVPAAKLSLTLGVAVGAAPCSKPTDCRSGRCDLSGGDGGSGICIDSCCSDKDCSGGTGSCAYQVYNGSTPAWQCAVWTSGHAATFGKTCASDLDCKANLCVGGVPSDFCNAPCCSKSDCGGLACSFYLHGDLPVRECVGVNGPACCTDTDCPGQHCQPVEVQFTITVYPFTKNAWVLRCQ